MVVEKARRGVEKRAFTLSGLNFVTLRLRMPVDVVFGASWGSSDCWLASWASMSSKWVTVSQVLV